MRPYFLWDVNGFGTAKSEVRMRLEQFPGTLVCRGLAPSINALANPEGGVIAYGK